MTTGTLTENEKKILRRIIRNQPDSYCEQVAADDTVARAEIQAKKPELLAAALQNMQRITRNLEKSQTEHDEAQAELDILQS